MNEYEGTTNENVEESLKHYGTPRHSGRYPWGSGKNPQRSKDLLTRHQELKRKGYTEKEIASTMGYKTTADMKSALAIASAARFDANYREAYRLKEKGMGYSAIGRRMGVNESTVRGWLDPARKRRTSFYDTTTSILKKNVSDDSFLDVGEGANYFAGVSKDVFSNSLKALEKQGYAVRNIKIQQLGTDNKTTMKILCKQSTTLKDIYNNLDKIQSIASVKEFVSDTSEGPKVIKLHDPVSIDRKRVFVRYAEDGGVEKDGTIELRRGVEDLDLGHSRYAQVRAKVGDSFYMKGMAYYSDTIPDGYDIVYNVNKKRGAPDEKVFKSLKEDPDNPFGALINRQNDTLNDDGSVKTVGALNIVREEGEWNQWKKTISSQMLSKQHPKVAKQQLDISYTSKEDEFEEIMSLTNPVIKKKLLYSFGDECDAAAVHLHGAAFPRQSYHVILPIPGLKENEVYAPQYQDGESVVLVRFPHGGTFEMPELTVNNRNREASKVIGKQSIDAIGINSKVAERLSGADFDGDTVLVIPNNDGRIKNSEPIQSLKSFDPKSAYPNLSRPKVGDPGNAFDKQMQMGMVSNLITDMTIKGASRDELARAVRHSMVVIDAKKHNLDWQGSYNDNNIKDLVEKYQSKNDPLKPAGGASTLISRASSQQDVLKRSLARTRKDEEGNYLVKEGIDVKTGKKVYDLTGEKKFKKVLNGDKDPVTGEDIYEYRDSGFKTQKSTKMFEAEDARDLMSGPNHEGTAIERVYADYANKCKALGNRARKEYLSVEVEKRDPVAAKEYATEVESLRTKLIVAKKNAPLERLAQARGNYKIKELVKETGITGAELKEAKGKELQRQRRLVGAKKDPVQITDREWEAIQKRAVSPTMLEEILNNTDMDALKKRAMPKPTSTISSTKQARIKAYASAGRSLNEIAEIMGLSTSTISDVLKT